MRSLAAVTRDLVGGLLSVVVTRLGALLEAGQPDAIGTDSGDDSPSSAEARTPIADAAIRRQCDRLAGLLDDDKALDSWLAQPDGGGQ